MQTAGIQAGEQAWFEWRNSAGCTNLMCRVSLYEHPIAGLPHAWQQSMATQRVRICEHIVFSMMNALHSCGYIRTVHHTEHDVFAYANVSCSWGCRGNVRGGGGGVLVCTNWRTRVVRLSRGKNSPADGLTYRQATKLAHKTGMRENASGGTLLLSLAGIPGAVADEVAIASATQVCRLVYILVF
jgi:hypothetical protein